MSESYLDAAGLNTLAGCLFDSETMCIHIGNLASTNGNTAIALGANAAASATSAIAVGHNANAKASGTIIVGASAQSGGNSGAVGIGSGAYATGAYGVAVGHNAHAVNTSCIGIGLSANTNLSGGIAVGASSKGSGVYSTAVGCNAKASGNYSTAVGCNSNAYTANAFQLGSSTLSTLNCAVSLTTSSDGRDKADTEPIGSACEFLANVQPVTYLRNPRVWYQLDEEELDEDGIVKRETYGLYGYDTEAWHAGEKKGSRQRAGVIAQEVQAALEATYGSADYANLVYDSLHDYEDVPDDVESQLTVNYSGFVPFLIEAVNELRERVEALEGASE